MDDQRLIDSRKAARLLGIGESTFHRHRALGLVGPEPIYLGKRIRWDKIMLNSWIDAGCPSSTVWNAVHGKPSAN